MKIETKFILIFVSALAIASGGFYIISQSDFLMPKGYHFCIEKGYDSTSFSGSYSPLYGKVQCVSCYKGECEYKEFNVKSNWLGIIKEVT